MTATLSPPEIARELADYQVELREPALAQLATYLELLLRWNRRVNLTGLQAPRAIVRRLFGESLYLSRLLELRGRLIDVGSGAGFPGLALKLVAPDLRVTLIEPRRRKGAFLREVGRECLFSAVDVVPERFESWLCDAGEEEKADIVTTRAVAMAPKRVQAMAGILAAGGKAAFFTTPDLGAEIRRQGQGLSWEKAHLVPHDKRSVILIGIHV